MKCSGCAILGAGEGLEVLVRAGLRRPVFAQSVRLVPLGRDEVFRLRDFGRG